MLDRSGPSVTDEDRTAVLQREVARRLAIGGTLDEASPFRASIIDPDDARPGCLRQLIGVVLVVGWLGPHIPPGIRGGRGPTTRTRSVITVDEKGALQYETQQLAPDN